MNENRFHFSPVGFVHSPYQEKFAIPRQPGLVTADQTYIRLTKGCNREEILRGLEGFSHLWVIFVFHEAIRSDWKPMVRPPRLGGNEKVGVFASRSPFRPNPIGLSVVKLEGIQNPKGQWCIDISGADLLHGTPILDIKPYIPYADCIDTAVGGFAPEPPQSVEVTFSESAKSQLSIHSNVKDIKLLITQVIAQQPQPAFHEGERTYGVKLYDLNIRWRRLEQCCEVISIEKASSS